MGRPSGTTLTVVEIDFHLGGSAIRKIVTGNRSSASQAMYYINYEKQAQQSQQQQE